MLLKNKLKIFHKTFPKIFPFTTKTNTKPLARIKSTSDIKEFWEDYGKIYSEMFENHSQQSLYSLLITMQINEAQNLFEMSIGGGKSLPLVCSLKNKNCHFLASDISESLLALAAKRMELIERDFNGNLQFWDKACFESSENKKFTQHFPKSNVSFRLLDNENLIGIPDNTFDAVFSNFSLHLVTNPEKMLSETLRVLKPGGRAGFTVWGRKKYSKFFTIVPNIMAKHGVVMPADRSNFHLGDRDILINMVKTNGFDDILCWYQFSAFGFTKKEEFGKILSSKGNEEILRFVPEEEKTQIKKEIIEEYMASIRNNEPLGLDTLFVVGWKKNIK